MKMELPPYALLPPCPVTVVCTYDAGGQPNGLAVSWAGVAVSEPPHLMIAVRPGRYSHAALCERGEFSVNIPRDIQMAMVDYFGITSGRKTNKFRDLGLTPVPGTHVNAPMIAEFPLSFECRVVSRSEIGTHSIFLAEILALHADEEILDSKNHVDVMQLRPIAYDHANYQYLGQGPVLGRAFSAGKVYKK